MMHAKDTGFHDEGKELRVDHVENQKVSSSWIEDKFDSREVWIKK